MKVSSPPCAAWLLLILVAAATEAQQVPVRPYVDPGQLDVPWPKHSHYKQPWRGFLETKSGYDFLAGIGVNYHVPAECGVTDEAGGWQLKALCASRSFSLWLNKGIDVMHYFVAHSKDPMGMGLLPVDLPRLAEDAAFDEVATPPMRVMRNLTTAFAGSVPLDKPRQLSVEVTALGGQEKVFEGDGAHPPLWHRDVLAVLPFQIKPGRFVVALYLVTYDATQPMAEERYRLVIKGASGGQGDLVLYDPHEDRRISLQPSGRGEDFVEVVVPVVDHPRLLTLTE